MQGKIAMIPPKLAARTDLPESPALSILIKVKPGLEGKLIGCLIADGTNAGLVAALKKSATEMGAQMKIVAPKIGGVSAKEGSVIEADFQLAGSPSVLFDCIFIALSTQGANTLAEEAAAVAFVHDAFAHLKVIGASLEAKPLLDKAGVVADQGIVMLKRGGSAEGFLKQAARGRIWDREPTLRAVY
jgi:catalase